MGRLAVFDATLAQCSDTISKIDHSVSKPHAFLGIIGGAFNLLLLLCLFIAFLPCSCCANMEGTVSWAKATIDVRMATPKMMMEGRMWLKPRGWFLRTLGLVQETFCEPYFDFMSDSILKYIPVSDHHAMAIFRSL